MSAEPITEPISAPALEPDTETIPQFDTPTVVPPTEWRFPISRNGLLGLLGLAVIALIPVFWPNKPFPYFVGAYALTYAMIGLSVTVVTGYAGLISLTGFQFARMPTGFIPDQDIGYLAAVVQLPPGSSLASVRRLGRIGGFPRHTAPRATGIPCCLRRSRRAPPRPARSLSAFADW